MLNCIPILNKLLLLLLHPFIHIYRSRDSTATAVVNAIRIATKSLGTHDLKGCVLYCTSQPGLMSFTACLWARIETICYGVSQQVLSR